MNPAEMWGNVHLPICCKQRLTHENESAIEDPVRDWRNIKLFQDFFVRSINDNIFEIVSFNCYGTNICVLLCDIRVPNSKQDGKLSHSYMAYISLFLEGRACCLDGF